MENTRKRKNIAVIIAAIAGGLILFAIIWGVIAWRLIGGAGGSSLRNIAGDTIDVVYVEGVIGDSGSLFSEPTYNHSWTLDQIDELMYSSSNQAILLYVNSPGGGVYESDELYLKLKEYKEVTGRPVYAYMAQTAASGGYYICMAADKVYANRMTLTGSIGVIMSAMDTTELEKKIGVKTENIVSGRNKAMGNPLTDEQRQILQAMVDETYNIFVEIVSENRNIDLNKAKELADGRIYSAMQAKALNLIDEIGDFNKVVDDLREVYDLHDAAVNDIVNEKTFFDSLFSSTSKKFALFNEFAVVKEYLDDKNHGKLMYYYPLQ